MVTGCASFPDLYRRNCAACCRSKAARSDGKSKVSIRMMAESESSALAESAFRRAECNDLPRLAIVEQFEIGTLKSGYRLTCLVSYCCVEMDEPFDTDCFTPKLLSLSKLRIFLANCSRLLCSCDSALPQGNSEDHQKTESGHS